MAKSKTNRSAAIREYLESHRKAQAQQVIDALAAKGITVTAGLVYAVKQKVRGKRHRRLAATAVASDVSSNGYVDAVMLVKRVRALAEQAGGMPKLRELLEVLS